MWPNLSDIENIKAVFFSIFLRHSLNKPVPRGVVASSDSIIQVMSCKFGVLNTHSLGFSSSEVLDTLSSLVVVLDVVNVAFIVDPFESVG